MKIAVFTDIKNAKLLQGVFRKYGDKFDILFVFELPEYVDLDNEKVSFQKNIRNVNIVSFDNNTDNAYGFLAADSIEYVIVYGWQYKIPPDIVKKIPIFNVHPSLLPKYRGPVPAIFQLLHEEHRGGVTIHKMDEDFDSGEIYKQREFEITDEENVASLSMKITRCAFRLIEELLADMIHSNIKTFCQDNSQSSYYSYKDLDQFVVNHDMTFSDFERIYHILYGYYPVQVMLNGKISEIGSYSAGETNGVIYSLRDREIYLTIK